MATVNVVLGKSSTRTLNGTSLLPIIHSNVYASTNLTSSGSSQNVGFGVPGGPPGLFTPAQTEQTTTYVWQITASGGNIWAKFGPLFTPGPTAAAGNDFLILDGQTREFGGSPGDTVAIIDA